MVEKLKSDYILKPIEILKVLTSRDGTKKYLLKLHDNNIVECVFLTQDYGNTICMSTQVGCRMGCKFCASTIGGKVRDLTAGEIIDQVIFAQKDIRELEEIANSHQGVDKTYAIQAGRELRVIVGADKVDDKTVETLSYDIAKKIQDEMTYPGQVKITVIRETRAVSFAK